MRSGLFCSCCVLSAFVGIGFAHEEDLHHHDVECEIARERFGEFLEADVHLRALSGEEHGAIEVETALCDAGNGTFFVETHDGEVFEGGLSDYELEGCALAQSEVFCERLHCSHGELHIAHFESCCSVLIGDPEPALECHAVHEEKRHVDISARTWGLALAAVTMTSLASLIGISLILCFHGRLDEMLLNDASAFAIGVLLSAVFVHILPETAEHGNFEWQHGSSFLGGVVTALVITFVGNSLGYGHIHAPNDLHMKDDAHEGPRMSEIVDVEDNKINKGGINYSLVTNIIVGDGFHNMVDGMIIGFAFSLCSNNTTGWVTTTAVLAHELPQELVDFIVLIRAGLPPWKALFLNFLSSITSFLGVIIVLSLSGSVDEATRGYMLAYGAGFLAYVALAELVPSIANIDSPRRKLLRLLFIIIGIFLIGMLGLFHEHCDAGHQDEHESHSH